MDSWKKLHTEPSWLRNESRLKVCLLNNCSAYCQAMKIIPSREMAAKPAAIWKALKDEGAVLVTRNGQPEGVFISTSDETWMEDLQEIVFARARRAISETRLAAARTGVANLGEEEIDGEIKAVRSARGR